MEKVRKRKTQKAVIPKDRFLSNLSSNHLMIGGFSVLAVIGFIQYYSPSQREIRVLKADARLEELRGQAEAKIANARYRNKCAMTYKGVPDVNGYYHEILPLSEGMTIISAHDGRVLTDGQIVCDHLFMTFEIVDGKTANGARATDAEAVVRRFNDFANWHPDARRGAIVEARKHDVQ